MSSAKPETGMIELKKKFGVVVNQVEQEFKNNAMAYKEKYYELVSIINKLYKDTKKYEESIEGLKQIKLVSMGSQEEISSSNEIKDTPNELDPIGLIEYVKEYSKSMVIFCNKLKERQQIVKNQMMGLFSAGSDAHYLEELAKKNLENFDLNLKVQQLSTLLSLKQQQYKLAERTTQQYQKKFKDYEKEYNLIVTAIANILKQSENSQMELRQENRLQRELIQSHRIEFERFKADFKLKPTFEEKVNKVKQVLQKQFQDRQALIIKQSQKIVENRLKCRLKENVKA